MAPLYPPPLPLLIPLPLSHNYSPRYFPSSLNYSLSIVESVEIVENVESVEYIENAESVVSVESVENVKSVESVENVESVEC